MDKTLQTMIDNLQKNTGKSLEEWIAIVQKQGFKKHGEAMKWLKEGHGLSHGFANLIVHKANASDAGSAENPEDLIDKQYQGKEHLRPLYEQLLAAARGFGDDVVIAPKNTYVSLRRQNQFALLNPASKSRFEIGLNLKGQEPTGILEAEKPKAMCSHKINLGADEPASEEVISWLRKAYEQAG